MALSQSTRLHYLNALGITVWQLRTVETSLISAEQSSSTHVETDRLPTDSWETLRQRVIQCERCVLCTTRTHTVFGEGNPNAKWLFIGDAPQQEDDLLGKPFVGEAGQLLTEMLRAMQLTREEVFITNMLKCRSPHDRDPQADEISACRDYAFEQIALINPKIIIAFGHLSAQTLLGTHDSIEKLREKVHSFQGKPFITVYHPAYLLRSPIDKRKAWQDLQFALQALDQTEQNTSTTPLTKHLQETQCQ